jgi:hypothetical protein
MPAHNSISNGLRNLNLMNNMCCSFNFLVYICVVGLLVVAGGVVVQSDETGRVWSEALFALTCCSSNQ